MALLVVGAAIPGGSAPRGQPAVKMIRSLPTDSGRVDIAANVLPLAGGALITGWTSMPGRPPDALLVRIDDQGEVIWRRHLGGERADILFSTQPDGAGGFVCAGLTASRGAGGTDGWVVRLDSAGDTTWQRTLGGAESDRLAAIQPSADGWMAAGHLSRLGEVDAWVVRLDGSGQEVGSATWGAPEVMDRAIGVAPVPDGGCVLVGGAGASREVSDGFVTRLGSDGRPSWTHRIGGQGFQVGYQLRADRDGSFLVTGYGYVSPRREHDGYVLRVDPRGKVKSHVRLGGTRSDRAVQSVILEDGSSITVGYTKRDGAADSTAAWTTMLYGVDSRGRQAWSMSVGGEGVESGRWIAGTREDLWVVSQTSLANGTSQMLVVRLEAPPPRN
jgi:hypothetical protein